MYIFSLKLKTTRWQLSATGTHPTLYLSTNGKAELIHCRGALFFAASYSIYKLLAVNLLLDAMDIVCHGAITASDSSAWGVEPDAYPRPFAQHASYTSHSGYRIASNKVKSPFIPLIIYLRRIYTLTF